MSIQSTSQINFEISHLYICQKMGVFYGQSQYQGVSQGLIVHQQLSSHIIVVSQSVSQHRKC